MIFLTENKYGRVRSRTCSNGIIKRTYKDQEDVNIPTAATNSVLLVALINEK